MDGIGAVFACLGAIVGAGFASGREIMAFFTCYGFHSWWLIALAAAVLTWISWLCMMHSSTAAGDWTKLFGEKNRCIIAISCCLMIITAGAMISAAGHLCSLVFANAGVAGGLCTVIAAWLVSRKNLKVLEWLSAGLSILLLCVLVRAFRLPANSVVLPPDAFSAGSLMRAAMSAAAYAAMNAMLALGVICRCKGNGRRVSAGLGVVFALLLGMSNALYLRQPAMLNTALPLVELLRADGRNGFLISAGLMYLSVFTTLTAVMCALRAAADSFVRSRGLCAILVMGLPLMVSCMGFAGIVDTLYAPAGLICLLGVFLPLQCKRAAQSNA